MEKANKKIYTNDMIALCHIVDEFDEFEKRLIPAISSKYNRNFVFQICDISQGKFKLGARKAKRFYDENKSVVDAISKYSSLQMFINKNYGCYGYYGKVTGDLRFFYEYLVSHKKDILNILKLLEKLKELGFDKFEFNEELDFTKEIYSTYSSFSDNFYFTYVANPQVIPNYTNDIAFTTLDSNYEMKFAVDNIDNSTYLREIVLNSLLFDSNTLPEKLDIEHTYEQLVRLKNEQQDKMNIIRNSVDLSVSVLDLEKQFNYTNETIDKLEYVENKEKLVEALTGMKKNLEKLKTLSLEHDSNISKKEPLLTSEILENEKTLYLERRIKESIDCC